MAFLEIVLAGLAAFILGFVWYTFLFGKMWQMETGISDEEAQSNILLTHGVSLLMMCTVACGINIIVGLHEVSEQTFQHGAFHGLMAAVFYGVPALVIHYMYQKKSLQLILIDGGYLLASFALAGGVLGALNL